MDLFLITRHDPEGYDTYFAHVVAAASASAARRLAANAAADEGEHVWLNPLESRCRILGEAESWVKPGIVLSNFNAG